jgi:aryl-alcohol dehydrogenase-like predicted oxidoreductase
VTDRLVTAREVGEWLGLPPATVLRGRAKEARVTNSEICHPYSLPVTDEERQCPDVRSVPAARRCLRSASAVWACPTFYGPADEAESIATIRAALDAGITLLDTGDYYGMGHNELLIRAALRGGDREQVVLSVKFGLMRGPDGRIVGNDLRPPAVKNFLVYTLRRLGTDHVDIYWPGRVFPDRPIEETVGAIAELVQAGYVRHIVLSEAGAETVRRARAVHPISDLQIEYSLLSRGIEDEILPACRELGIGITAYGVLSRGLLAGHWSKERAGTLASHDFRASARGSRARASSATWRSPRHCERSPPQRAQRSRRS